MEKSLITILGAAAVLAMASCNSSPASSKSGDAYDESSSNSASGLSTSSENSSAGDDLSVLEAALELLVETKNSTYTDSDEMLQWKFVGDDKGIFLTYSAYDEKADVYDAYEAYVNIPDYGSYFLEILDNDVVNATIYYPVSINFTDFFYSPYDIGVDGLMADWTVDDDGNFVTDDLKVAYDIASLYNAGLVTFAFENAVTTLSVSESTGSIDVSLALSESDYYNDITLSGVISEIGSTESAFIDAYLASKPTFTAPTGFSEKFLGALDTMGVPEGAVPFPEGVSYAFAEDVDSMDIYDYKAGDLVDSYSDQLEAAGFELDEEESDPTGEYYGYPYMVYTKAIAEPTEKYDTTYLYVTTYFLSPEDLDEDAEFYPYGRFVAEYDVYAEELPVVYDEAAFVEYLNSFKNPADESKNAIPTLDLKGMAGDIELDDMSPLLLFLGYEVEVAFLASIEIETLEKANSIVDDYCALFTPEWGFETDDEYYAPAKGFYKDVMVDDVEWTVEVIISATDDEGEFDGHIYFELYIYA